MKLGNKIFILIFSFFIFQNFSFAEDKIISTPLINIDELKPSFEELDDESENVSTSKNLKEKKIK